MGCWHGRSSIRSQDYSPAFLEARCQRREPCHLLNSLMDTFRTRTLSSGDDISEIVIGMELHERLPEHTNREFYGNARNNFWSGFSMHNFSTAGDSDEHSVAKKAPKEISCIYTFLSTLLFAVVLIVENIFHYKLFVNTHASLSFYWLESAVIVLFFRFWGRKRIRR